MDTKANKEEEKKGNKNVLKVVDSGDFVTETRQVARKGMQEPKTYDLKVPKTIKSAVAIYGEEETLKLFIESLKTKNDDAIARGGITTQASQLRNILKGVTLTPELLAKIEALAKS